MIQASKRHDVSINYQDSRSLISLSGFCSCFFFFFQAEDGIRDHCVTGVQTCALPIFPFGAARAVMRAHGFTRRTLADLVYAGLATAEHTTGKADGMAIEAGRIRITAEIGRASCRERV